ADEETEQRERRAEEAADEQRRIATVHGEGGPEGTDERRVADGEEDAGKQSPPAVQPQPAGRCAGGRHASLEPARILSETAREVQSRDEGVVAARQAWRGR